MSGITVRSRERPIYTTGRKVYSDLRRKFQHKVGTFNTHRKHCATSTLSQRRRFASALLTQAETAGARAGKQPAKVLASGLPTLVETSDTCARRTQRRDFRRSQFSHSTSGVPTRVGTSDTRSHRR